MAVTVVCTKTPVNERNRDVTPTIAYDLVIDDFRCKLATMRISISALLLICVLLDGAAAGDDKRRDADALFASANSLLGTGQPKSGPYTLKGHFRLVIAQPVEGTIQKAVLSEREEWRTEISFPGYSETVLRNGNRTWRRRDATFTPLRVGEVLAALKPHFEVQEKEKVEKVSEQTQAATRIKCVKLTVNGNHREVCLDAATGLPFSSKRSDEFGSKEIDYESYSSVGGKQFPAKVRLTDGGQIIAEFWLDSVSLDAPDQSLFDPLPGVVAWPICDDVKPPVPTSATGPSFSGGELENRPGTVFIHLVVDERGHPRDVAVARSFTPALDNLAIAAVSKWRFKPAMCGTEPVPLETYVQVSFPSRRPDAF